MKTLDGLGLIGVTVLPNLRAGPVTFLEDCADVVSLKAGVHLKPVFRPLNLGLPFQAFPKPSAHSTKLCLAVFCKFFGDFRGCLGRDIYFSKDY